MKKYNVKEIHDLLIQYGRTYFDIDGDTLHFNWTASGVAFTFCGTSLNATFCADYGEEVEGLPTDLNALRRKTWPWVAVLLDDMPMPVRRFEISSPSETWLLYQSEKPEVHRIRIVKLTEDFKTYVGLKEFHAEGEFLPTERVERKRIEFVGDSITCGFGNVSQERDRGFFSGEEDGWLAYGARAARLLGMECSCVCISGITAVRHKSWLADFSMKDIYRYTDKLHQDKTGRYTSPEVWDFKEYHNDYVVLNLGTNDAYAILFGGDDSEEAAFDRDYLAFIQEVRDLNGPGTYIVCSLGSMNYYLYHNIVRAVERYKQQTGDDRIICCKFNMINPMDGFGAAGHPSMTTHEKMANEIATVIRSIEGR